MQKGQPVKSSSSAAARGFSLTWLDGLPLPLFAHIPLHHVLSSGTRPDVELEYPLR
jgi:hypothetical protein